MSIRSINRTIAEVAGKVPLRIVLIVPFVLLIVGAVGLVGYLSFRNGQQAVNVVTSQLRSEVSDRVKLYLDTYLATPHLINRINVDAVRSSQLDLQDLPKLERYLFWQLQQFNSVTTIIFGSNRGNFIASDRLTGKELIMVSDLSDTSKISMYALDSLGNRGKLQATFRQPDARKSLWYQAAVGAVKPTWAQIFQLGNKADLTINANRPIYDQANNELLGVFSVNLNLTEISEFLHSLPISKSGKIFIIERNGFLVADSVEEKLYISNSKKEFKRLKVTESRNALISATGRYLLEQFGDFTKVNSNQQLEFIKDGERQFVQVVPFRDEFGLDWLLAVVVPESDFMEQINANAYTTIGLCAVTLVVATGIGILTARWIAKPILGLNTAAKEIAQGQWDKTVDIKRSDEVGQLAKSFNSMAAQLQASFAELTSLNAALHNSDRKFRGIFNQTFEFTGLLSIDGVLLEANQTALDFGGLQREDVIGKPFWECYWWTISEETQTQLQAAIKRSCRGEFIRYEVDVLAADSSVVTVDFSLKPIFDENGNIKFVISEGRDIIESKQVQRSLADYNRTLEAQVVQRTAELININDQLKHEIAERQQVAQALRESEERFREIAGTISQFFFIRSASSGQFIYVSPSYERIWGRSCESLYENPQSWIEALHPDDRELVLNSLREQFQGNSVKREYRIIQPNGSIRWIVADISVVRDQAGQLLRFVGLAEDITERKQAEAEIIRSKELLESIFNESTDAIFLVNAETLLITNCNRRAVELFEAQSKDELLNIEGRTLQKKSFTPEDLNTIVDEIALYGFWSWELEYVTKKGKLFWGSLAAREIYVAGQKMHLVRVTDITTRKQAEDALRTSEAQNRALLNAIPDLMIRMTKDGTYLDFRPAKNFKTVVSGSDFIGKSIYEIMPSEVSQQRMQYVKQALSTGNPQSYEFQLMVDGSVYEQEARIVVCGEDEVLVIVRDITARKQAEEALRQLTKREQEKSQTLELTLSELKRTQAQLIQAEKMSSLGQMIAGIAHEINNPVSFIYGNLTPARHYFQDLLSLIELYQQTYPHPTPEIQQLSSELDLDFLLEDWQKLIDSMQVGAERISEIVRSLRNFSRLDEKELKPVDIHEGIDNTLLILKHRLRADGNHPEIQVIKDYGQLPPVICYASQLNQVFMNLLNNAIDALETRPAPRLITICTSLSQKLPSDSDSLPGSEFSAPARSKLKSQKGTTPIPNFQWVFIRIADNGFGMSQEVLHQIFDPFFTTKPVGTGTGLGLSISYQIVVEKHKGHISCVSAPGQGTEFIVKIPVRQANAQH
jgi:PAS domain S-box-containing protein